jgi:hypothetical protein
MISLTVESGAVPLFCLCQSRWRRVGTTEPGLSVLDDDLRRSFLVVKEAPLSGPYCSAAEPLLAPLGKESVATAVAAARFRRGEHARKLFSP